MQAPPWADSSFCFSTFGVLATVSSYCPPPKGKFYVLLTRPPLKTPLGCFLSDLHVFSMSPTFILNHGQILHEIHNYIA